MSAKASSLLDQFGTLNAGATTLERRYLRIVFRDRPVRREISRIDSRSRNAQRKLQLVPTVDVGGATQVAGMASFVVRNSRGAGVVREVLDGPKPAL